MRLTLAYRVAALLLCILPSATAFAGDVILKFEAQVSSVLAGSIARIDIETQGASYLYIGPSWSLLSQGDMNSTISVRPTQSTTYTLVAQDAAGVEIDRAIVDIEAGPFAIKYFTTTESFLGSTEPTTLTWHVAGEFDGAEVVGLTSPSDEAYGSFTFVPGVTQDVELLVTAPGFTSSKTVHLDVSQDFQESRFYLSYDAQSIQLEATPVEVFSPFLVHVLGLSLEGSGIRGFEFGVDLPQGVQILGVEYDDPLVLNIVQPPDFIVGYAYCLPTNNYLYEILTLHLMADNTANIDEDFISLRPSLVQSVPDRLAYVTCRNSLEGSEFSDARQALAGPPLYLSPQEQVPTLQLGFRAVRKGAAVQLEWGDLPYPIVDRLVIGRAEAGREAQPLVSFRGDELLRRQAYMDASAPSGVELEYVLRAYEGQELLSEESAKLAPGSSVLPARTRIQTNFPNPFNPETTIRFDAATPGRYEFHIVDAAGRRVRLLETQIAAAGSGYEIRWNGLDESGSPAASGVYFVQLRGPNVIDQHRIALIK